ncbi:MAG: hypothetical protein QG674_420 [Patescibacteria group bacterium]|jgi:Flp pilus assembly protein protease CpaA|nr:hypothetical protein [Patescibacteria group bacterium]
MKVENFGLTQADLKKVVKNALIFFAPALLIFLLEIQGGGDIKVAIVAIKLWAINTAIDLLKKYIAESK